MSQNDFTVDFEFDANGRAVVVDGCILADPMPLSASPKEVAAQGRETFYENGKLLNIEGRLRALQKTLEKANVPKFGDHYEMQGIDGERLGIALGATAADGISACFDGVHSPTIRKQDVLTFHSYADVVAHFGEADAMPYKEFFERGNPYVRIIRPAVTGTIGVALRSVPADPEPTGPCQWCTTPGCKMDAGSTCRGYQRCLTHRLALGGASDCAEERESVRRWCDVQRQTWPDPYREAPTLCFECPPERRIVATHRNENGVEFCVYCYNCDKVSEAKARSGFARNVNAADARARNEAASAAERPRLTRQAREEAKPHPWETFWTPGDES